MPTTPTAPQTDRIELWTPPELREAYAEIADDLRVTLTPLDAGDWFEQLAGNYAPGKDKILRSPLAWHLRAVLTATRYDGAAPGSVPPPPQLNLGASPEALAGHQAASVAHRNSQRLIPEFLDAVRAVAVEVLADRQRAWDAHVHLVTLDAARRETDARAVAIAAETARLVAAQCPRCHASDTDRIGPVVLRPLLPGLVHVFDGIAAVRSCLACWNVLAAVHVQQLADERLDDGRTRAATLGIPNPRPSLLGRDRR